MVFTVVKKLVISIDIHNFLTIHHSWLINHHWLGNLLWSFCLAISGANSFKVRWSTKSELKGRNRRWANQILSRSIQICSSLIASVWWNVGICFGTCWSNQTHPFPWDMARHNDWMLWSSGPYWGLHWKCWGGASCGSMMYSRAARFNSGLFLLAFDQLSVWWRGWWSYCRFLYVFVRKESCYMLASVLFPWYPSEGIPFDWFVI